MKKNEEVLGWYHSHPNYGPWLSGIDVNTQQNMQTAGPMLAIVIDPIRSQLSGRVDIGAFRTCKPDNSAEGGIGESIPEEKIKDFGTHYKHYYKLDIEYFMSQKDYELIQLCWTKFWTTILESEKLLENRDDYRKTLNDLIIKTKKSTNATFNLGSLVGKKNTTAETEQLLKSLSKFTIELNQEVHKDCIKTLAFS